MCEFMSFIVTRSGKVFFSKVSKSHEDIIKENNLNDTKMLPDICRVEIKPKNRDFSIPIEIWDFCIDQEKPEWFTEKHEKAVRGTFKKHVFDFLKIDCKFSLKVGFCYAGKNATVEAWDNATVKASDNATVKASDNATVEAWDNATVKARGNATVEASDNATVEASDNAITIIENYFFKFNGKISLSGNAQKIERIR